MCSKGNRILNSTHFLVLNVNKLIFFFNPTVLLQKEMNGWKLSPGQLKTIQKRESRLILAKVLKRYITLLL